MLLAGDIGLAGLALRWTGVPGRRVPGRTAPYV